MKKTLFMLIVIIFTLNFCTLDMIVKQRNDANEYIVLKNNDELVNILENNEDVILYFYKKDCIACNDFKTILNKVIVDENLNVYGVDMTGSDFNYNDILSVYNLMKTPSVIVYKNTIEIARIEGNVSEKNFTEFVHNYYISNEK